MSQRLAIAFGRFAPVCELLKIYDRSGANFDHSEKMMLTSYN